MVHRIRRVVTGLDRKGKSIFISDGEAPNVMEMASMPGLAITDLWRTGSAPASNSGNADSAAGRIKLEPPPSGTILRIVEFPPDAAWRGTADPKKAFASIGASGAPDPGASDALMHATATVDYIIVIKGEIWAILDEGEKLLKPGDILVQRGTNHSWSVRGHEPAIVVAVLVGAKPVGRLVKKKSASRSKPRRALKRKVRRGGKRR